MLLLPADRLPTDVHQRHAHLREYFLDKDATATFGPAGWELALDWPDGHERHVDPRLAEGLAWWNGGVTLPTMALQYRRAGRIATALYDTWTLVSWSEWLSRQGPPTEHLTVLHVDDHRDLGSPRLVVDGSALRDPITGDLFDVRKPELVRGALMSGALGMGSFMTPFLRAFPQTEVRHLCQPPKAPETIDFTFESVIEADTLLDPGAPRPAIALAKCEGETGPGHYRVTPSVSKWLADLSPGPALLHIDMDYFNNRFDGDSAWADYAPSLDPPLDQVLAKIDELVEGLAQPGLACRIEDVVIAYSPGFFPAEYWGAADRRLRAGLERLP